MAHPAATRQPAARTSHPAPLPPPKGAFSSSRNPPQPYPTKRRVSSIQLQPLTSPEILDHWSNTRRTSTRTSRTSTRTSRTSTRSPHTGTPNTAHKHPFTEYRHPSTVSRHLSIASQKADSPGMSEISHRITEYRSFQLSPGTLHYARSIIFPSLGLEIAPLRPTKASICRWLRFPEPLHSPGLRFREASLRTTSNANGAASLNHDKKSIPWSCHGQETRREALLAMTFRFGWSGRDDPPVSTCPSSSEAPHASARCCTAVKQPTPPSPRSRFPPAPHPADRMTIPPRAPSPPRSPARRGSPSRPAHAGGSPPPRTSPGRK